MELSIAFRYRAGYLRLQNRLYTLCWHISEVCWLPQPGTCFLWLVLPKVCNRFCNFSTDVPRCPILCHQSHQPNIGLARPGYRLRTFRRLTLKAFYPPSYELTRTATNEQWRCRAIHQTG